MSNPSLIHRSNQNSSLFNTIKARNSKRNQFNYVEEGEANICPTARSRIVINPTTTLASGGNQTIKFELVNFGMLEELYLQTSFLQGGTNADGSNDVHLVDQAGIFAWTRCRIVYNGNTIAELTPEQVLASLYTRANAERVAQLDAMTGGMPIGAAAAVGSLEGRRLLASAFGGQTLSCPLGFWFSESLGRAWDLYSLSARAYVEVDYRANADLHTVNDSTACLYSEAKLIAYISEMAPEELVAYQSSNYSPNSVSSQISFTTTQFSDSIASPVLITASSTAGNKVKIQSISGLVRRLYLFATLDSDRASTTAKEYNNSVDIASWKLMANNQVIYENQHSAVGVDTASLSAGTGYNTDTYIEMVRNNLPMASGKSSDSLTSDTFKLFDVAVDKSLGAVGGGGLHPAHIKVINFGYNPQSLADADGCLSFSQLSVPEIECKWPTGTSAAVTLHVIAEVLTLNTYNTSANGQINYKLITE